MIFTDAIFWFYFFILIGLIKVLPRRMYPYVVCAFSIFFYGSLNYQFLIPLFICLFLDYIVCLCMDRSKDQLRTSLMIFGVTANLLMLFYYKYYFNFISTIFQLSGIDSIIERPLFPVGISFYIFQSISYVLDVYRRRAPAEKNFFVYVLYVTFFPQLVIGPIEKGHHLIPQFKDLKFIGLQNCEEGLHLILYGLFKKVCVGDSLSFIIASALKNPNIDLPSTILISILTTFKIYADFSGYSDIARGVAKLLNINLVINFYPFFTSKNPSEFWASWHLSLTSWVKEYLFSSLLGKNATISRYYISLFLSFMIIGIWHGPTLNWLLFGIFHGVVVIAYRLLKKNQIFKKIPSQYGYMFMIFFYAVCGFLHNNTELGKIDFLRLFSQNFDATFFGRNLLVSMLFLSPLIFFDVIQLRRNKEFFLQKNSIVVRYSIYFFWYILVLIFNHSNEGFVYYQF